MGGGGDLSGDDDCIRPSTSRALSRSGAMALPDSGAGPERVYEPVPLASPWSIVSAMNVLPARSKTSAGVAAPFSPSMASELRRSPCFSSYGRVNFR